MKLAVLALCGLVASVAHADVWQHAIATGNPDVVDEIYRRQLREGDEEAIQAVVHSASRDTIEHHINLAVRAYRTAATTRPTEGEPYYRIGMLLYRFYADCNLLDVRALTCDPIRTNFDKVADTVAAWDAFEARAPLDPRVNALLVDRAIQRTKLVTTKTATKKLLEGAARDYQASLDRHDGLTMLRDSSIWGNLAETYMMLGRLDEAVEAYKEALRRGAPISTTYGLAVALDRDDRGLSARDVIVEQGLTGYEAYAREYNEHQIFYVPEGEEYYYFALVSENLGHETDAITQWQRYLASGAHPEYQPRARVHLDALVHRRSLHPVAPPPTPSELLQ